MLCWSKLALVARTLYPAGMVSSRNLIMVHTPVKQALADFTTVAERMALRAEGLRAPAWVQWLSSGGP